LHHQPRIQWILPRRGRPRRAQAHDPGIRPALPARTTRALSAHAETAAAEPAAPETAAAESAAAETTTAESTTAESAATESTTAESTTAESAATESATAESAAKAAETAADSRRDRECFEPEKSDGRRVDPQPHVPPIRAHHRRRAQEHAIGSRADPRHESHRLRLRIAFRQRQDEPDRQQEAESRICSRV
jgi:hypothetical protein